MRIDLPACAFTPCKYYFDGNCMVEASHERCDYRRLHDAEQDRLNPRQLTVEELKSLPLHEQVYVHFTEPYAPQECEVPSAYYSKVRAVNSRDCFAFGYPGMCFELSFSDYGDTWLTYRTKPEGSNT